MPAVVDRLVDFLGAAVMTPNCPLSIRSSAHQIVMGEWHDGRAAQVKGDKSDNRCSLQEETHSEI